MTYAQGHARVYILFAFHFAVLAGAVNQVVIDPAGKLDLRHAPSEQSPAILMRNAKLTQKDQKVKQQSMLEQTPSTTYHSPLETKWSASLMIYCPCIFVLLWCAREMEMLALHKVEDESEQVKKLVELSEKAYSAACSFMLKQEMFIFAFVLLMCCLITVFVSHAAMFAFLAGSLTNICCAHGGMKCSFKTNMKASYAALKGGPAGSLPEAFSMVMKGASLNGLYCVSIAVLVFYTMILSLHERGWLRDHPRGLFEAMTAYAWGASAVALFMRAASGVFANTASLGAGAIAKSANLGEDDAKNPAVLADNVGDMVLGVGATSADFASWFAECTVMAMVVGGAYLNMMGNLPQNWGFMSYPILLFSTGTLVAIPTMLCCRSMFAVSDASSVGKALSAIMLLGTIVQTGAVIGINYLAVPENLPGFVARNDVTRWEGLGPVIIGIWFGFIVATMSNYYTSSSFQPVRRIASSQGVSAATGIIFGLANGYMSCVIPTILLGATMLTCFRIAGMYGVCMAAVGMMPSLTLRLTVHSFGPIADNARGMSGMAGMPQEALDVLDILDTCGKEATNGTKSFCFGSVGLVGLSLFVAYCEQTQAMKLDLLDSWTFFGLLLGSLQPFMLAAILMKSVGLTAQKVVLEALDQISKAGQDAPDYQKSISICSTAGMIDMLTMALMMELPLFIGMTLGTHCVAGFIAGTLASGIMLAMSLNNSGASWESAKRYLNGPPKTNGLPPTTAGAAAPQASEADTAPLAAGAAPPAGETTATTNAGTQEATPSSAQAAPASADGEKPKGLDNASIGEFVGYATKEVVGPALNVLIKVTGITALLFAQTIVNGSNAHGGPFFLK